MKNRKQHDLEELLKNNLTDKTAIVPEFVWDKIEEELFPKKKRRGFFWLFFFGGLLMAGIFAARFFSAKNDRDRNIAISEYDDIPKFKTAVKSSTDAQQERESMENNETIPKNGKAVSGDESENSQQENEAKNLMTESSNLSNDFHVGNQKKLKKSVVFQRKTILEKNSDQTLQGDEIQVKEKELSILENMGHSKSWIQRDSGEITILPFRGILFQVERNSDSLAKGWTQQINEPKDKKLAIAMYGGTSMYEMAVFKEYFTSGQLSKRTFKSSGFEVGAGLNYKLGNKFGIYSNIAFNRKITSFNYNLAITESDYFDHVLNGELLPIETIIDNGIGNCFLVENVAAQYKIDSWLISLGTTYELLKWRKLSVGLDLRFSANLNSTMDLEKLTVLKIQDYSNEKFNYLKIGGGLAIDYRFSDRFSAGIAPVYHFQLNPDKQSFYAGRTKELVVPVVFKVYF